MDTLTSLFGTAIASFCVLGNYVEITYLTILVITLSIGVLAVYLYFFTQFAKRNFWCWVEQLLEESGTN